MTEIKDSIWQQNSEGNWNLFFNLTEEDSLCSYKENEKNFEKSKNNIKPPQNSLILGTIVMTPDGIGRLIKLEQEFGYIKTTKGNTTEEKKYEIKNISSIFNLFVSILEKGRGEELIRLRMKCTGNVKDIFSQLEMMNKISKNIEIYDYNLLYNGSIVKNELNFEQINDIKNNSKMLLFIKKMKNFSINRFKLIGDCWSSGNEDGITFVVSKRIFLTGVSLYGSYQSKTIHGTIKVLEGDNDISNVLYQQEMTLQPSSSKNDAIRKISFEKRVKLNDGQKYSIKAFFRDSSSVYSGNDGKTVIEGEGGVSFTFYTFRGRNVGTSPNIGNFPEFHYYLN